MCACGPAPRLRERDAIRVVRCRRAGETHHSSKARHGVPTYPEALGRDRSWVGSDLRDDPLAYSYIDVMLHASGRHGVQPRSPPSRSGCIWPALYVAQASARAALCGRHGVPTYPKPRHGVPTYPRPRHGVPTYPEAPARLSGAITPDPGIPTSVSSVDPASNGRRCARKVRGFVPRSLSARSPGRSPE